ncbi:hypothetical protein TU51_09350 [Bacillus cytotoxicus]|nr:hypothetical protein CG482_009800 [Bacillus cytotoxicus]AWC36713.1 hypothetical protein CG481_009815 [Bacillus cytotoxicus]AWC60969.1 hypothetical protein CG474_009875 [Bacillus cytotoxicus]KMT51151.1 hypothetical protein TU51_09350 [Bacillus cytotoxicus]
MWDINKIEVYANHFVDVVLSKLSGNKNRSIFWTNCFWNSFIWGIASFLELSSPRKLKCAFKRSLTLNTYTLQRANYPSVA